MMKKSSGVFIVAIAFIWLGLYGIAGTASASNEILINEFAISPSGNQWIELINTSSSSFTLSNWEARILDSSLTVNTFAMDDIVIPAGGLAVYDFPSDVFDLSGGAMFILGDSPQTTLEIGYGSVNLPGADYVEVIPGEGQSASLVGEEWTTVSSSKYWFNNASGLGNSSTPPELSDVSDALAALGINTNIADFSNPLDADGLYFSKNNVGRIQFGNNINLSDSSIVESIKDLTGSLVFTTGTVAFLLNEDSVLRNLGATITLYRLSEEDYSQEDLIVKDNEGSVIDLEDADYPIISNFNFNLPTQSLSFQVDHFTSFSVPTDFFDFTPPVVSFASPTPADGTSINQEAEIKVSSTENMSQAVITKITDINGDFEQGNFSSWTTGGGANWQISSSTKYSGLYSAKSGYPATSTSWIKKVITVAGNSTLWFRWKIFSSTSSEDDPNNLKFFVDNEEIVSISDTQDWEQEQYSLAQGSHELKWQFSNGSLVNSSTDAGWLDDLMIFDSSSSHDMTISNYGSSSVATYNLPLDEGENSYQVFVRDLAGNYGFSEKRIVNYDLAAPVAVLSDLPSISTSNNSASISVGGQDVAYYKYNLDNQGYGSEISTSTRLSLSSLAVGNHNLRVLGRDIANNWQTTSTNYSWTISSSGGGGGGGGGGGSYPPTITISNPVVSTPIVSVDTPISNAPEVNTSQAIISGGKVLGIKSYANGSLLRSTTTKRIYALEKYQKKYISTLKELKKYRNRAINNVDDSVIASYPDYRPDGTLIRKPDGKIYVIKNGRRQHITTLKELKAKYRGKRIWNLSDDEVNLYKEI